MDTHEVTEDPIGKYLKSLFMTGIILLSIPVIIQIFLSLIVLFLIFLGQSFYFITIGMGEHSPLFILYSLLSGLAGAICLFADYKIAQFVYRFIAGLKPPMV